MTVESPTCELDYRAACARSVENAAPAKTWYCRAVEEQPFAQSAASIRGLIHKLRTNLAFVTVERMSAVGGLDLLPVASNALIATASLR